MSQFSVGVYKTKAGIKAIVAQLRTIGVDWVLVGAVEDPFTRVLKPATWSLAGQYQSVEPLPALDLAERIGN